MMMAPKASVIIPSLDGYRDGNVPRLISQLENQTFRDLEVILIKGVRPNGNARNAGAKKAIGEILISIDDDVTLGHEKVIENLVRHLESDDTIGLLGISKLIPKDSNRFQRRCAKEIPRSTSPIYDELTEGDLVELREWEPKRIVCDNNLLDNDSRSFRISPSLLDISILCSSVSVGFSVPL